MHTEEQGKKLLRLARKSIEEEFNRNKIEKIELDEFKEKSGIFVTINKIKNKKKELRGCVGFPYAIFSLGEAVIKAAKSAAFSDPRFLPLKEEELKEIKIEISVLTHPEICEKNDVKIGKDGLICDYLGHSGLLLPQVAVERKMTRDEFIKSLCQKAGLDKDSYKKQGFKLFKFQCQIFSE